MSKKTNGIQVGNFIVTRDNGSEHDWKHGSKYVSLLVMQPLTLSLWKSFLKAILILPNGYEACSNQYHRKMMPRYWKKRET